MIRYGGPKLKEMKDTHTHTTATCTQTAATRATTVAEQAAATAAAADDVSAGLCRSLGRRRASAGVDDDVARLQTAGATSSRCVVRDGSARHDTAAS